MKRKKIFFIKLDFYITPVNLELVEEEGKKGM